MRGAPSQWAIGSQWIADGGVYPGMGESIGLAGTSPELADGGLYNDEGQVGDPPFDAYTGEMYDTSMGAGTYGGPGGSVAPHPAAAGGPIADVVDDPFKGLLVVAGGTLVVFWAMHRFRTGDQNRFASIKGTAGDIAIIGFASALVLPAIKATVTWIADATDWSLAWDAAAWVNAS